LTTLRHKLQKVHDLGVFEAVEFDIDTHGDKQRVTVTTREKPYAPNIFHLGVDGDATFRGDTHFSMLARMTRLERNGWGGEWRTSVAAGTRLLFDSEFYQPMGVNRRWFMAVDGRAASNIQYIYENDSRAAVQQFQELLGGVDVGLPLGRLGEFRTGLRWGWVGSSVVTGQSPLPSFDGKQGLWNTRFHYVMLDDADFPHDGGSGKVVLRISTDALGAEGSYERLLLTWTEYMTYKRTTAFCSVAGGGSFDSGLPSHDQFLLGGFTSFAGYNTDQYRGNYLGTLRLGTYIRLGNPIQFIGTQWYSGMWGDVGNVWPSRKQVRADDMRLGGAVFVGADTIVGPAFVTGGLASGGVANIYVTLGLQVGVRH
jgi:NTE family protein